MLVWVVGPLALLLLLFNRSGLPSMPSRAPTVTEVQTVAAPPPMPDFGALAEQDPADSPLPALPDATGEVAGSDDVHRE